MAIHLNSGHDTDSASQMQVAIEPFGGVPGVNMVGTIDRKDRSDICCGKLAFKRMSIVPEAYYWYKLSIFFSLHTSCVD